MKSFIFICFFHLCLLHAEEAPAVKAKQFSQLLISYAFSPEPLEEPLYHDIEKAAYNLCFTVRKNEDLEPLYDPEFLKAAVQWSLQQGPMTGNETPELDSQEALDRVLDRLFWSKHEEPDESRKVLAVKMTRLLNFIREAEELSQVNKDDCSKQSIFNNGTVVINGVVTIDPSKSMSPLCTRLGALASVQQLGFRSIWGDLELFQLMTDDARVAFLKEAGLSLSQIEFYRSRGVN